MTHALLDEHLILGTAPLFRLSVVLFAPLRSPCLRVCPCWTRGSVCVLCPVLLLPSSDLCVLKPQLNRSVCIGRASTDPFNEMYKEINDDTSLGQFRGRVVFHIFSELLGVSPSPAALLSRQLGLGFPIWRNPLVCQSWWLRVLRSFTLLAPLLSPLIQLIR